MPVPDNLPYLGLEAYLTWKIFGPAAGVLGRQLSELVEFAGENVKRVSEVTVKKVGSRIDEPGELPARTLLKAFEEAAISDDEIVAEYLGGVLASDREKGGSDDRGVSWTALIGRMSSDQLRLHYVLYATLHELSKGSELNLGDEKERSKLKAYAGLGDLLVCCNWWDPESDEAAQSPEDMFAEAFDGLHRESLVDDAHKFGALDFVRDEAPGVEDAGLIWQPSLPGIRLYLWGHGQGHRNPNAFVEETLDAPTYGDFALPANVYLTSELKTQFREQSQEENTRLIDFEGTVQ